MKNGLIIGKYGTKYWYKDDLLHREEDLPAIEDIENDKFWYKEGLLHREAGKPAIEYGNGEKEWYYEGKKLDAEFNEEALKMIKMTGLIINDYKNKKWYKEGLLHREDDLPAIEYYNGTKYWYKQGNIHREGDLPAVEYDNGSKKWYKEGKLHREGGLPAIEIKGGSKSWFYNGQQLDVKSNKEALKIIKLKAFW